MTPAAAVQLVTRLFELGKRQRLSYPRSAAQPHLFERLRRGEAPAAIATDCGLPVATVEGVRSYYDQLHKAPRVPGSGSEQCSGTACWYARRLRGDDSPPSTVHCLGRCYEAPATEQTASAIPVQSLVNPSRLFRYLLTDDDPWLDFELPNSEQILQAVEDSGLRGRGGAAYPTAAKWRVAKDTPASDRVVVANGDEGDPGSYVDRLILEEQPQALLAGMLACARAIGARTGIVFVRGEYERAAHRLEAAIREADRRLLLRDELTVTVIRGAGSYVAGEETALLRAIEGLRAEPSPKPPYPAEVGLGGLPTVVQNIETLALVPWVVRHQRPPNTKAVCLSGAVKSPGVVEVELGTPLRTVLKSGGAGAPPGVRWKLALVGGPMGRVLTEPDFDTPLHYETLPGMGHAGVTVFDDSLSIPALYQHLANFAASESCGNCTPCRVGTAQLRQCTSLQHLERLLETLELGSLCGFGSGVPRPLRDLIRYYGAGVLS